MIENNWKSIESVPLIPKVNALKGMYLWRFDTRRKKVLTPLTPVFRPCHSFLLSMTRQQKYNVAPVMCAAGARVYKSYENNLESSNNSANVSCS